MIKYFVSYVHLYLLQQYIFEQTKIKLTQGDCQNNERFTIFNSIMCLKTLYFQYRYLFVSVKLNYILFVDGSKILYF